MALFMAIRLIFAGKKPRTIYIQSDLAMTQLKESGIIFLVKHRSVKYKSMVYYNARRLYIPAVEFSMIKLTPFYRVTIKYQAELRSLMKKQSLLCKHSNHRPVSLKKVSKTIYDLFEIFVERKCFIIKRKHLITLF